MAGINYYRLEQTDYNGTTYLSHTIALKNEVEHPDGVHLFPNPAVDFLTVIPENEDYNIEIFDASGSSVIKTRNKNKIDISGLTDGIYFSRINSVKNNSVQKITIQR